MRNLNKIMALVCLVLCLTASASVRAADHPDFLVTLLGTGGPPPDPNRFGPATLVEAGNQKLLFDVGRGTPIRLWQAGIPIRAIDAVFLTHFHSDHVIGIPDVWLSGWLGGPFARRTTPFAIHGPTGTRAMMSHLQKAYAADIRIRMADEHYPPDGIRVIASEFEKGGLVYEASGVRVTAFEVDHGVHVKPAYGYRIDYDGRSVVISGDTRFSENVIKFATGTDLLIHEVAAVRPQLLNDPQVRRVMDHHTSPQELGRVFDRTRPRLGVMTHLILLARKNVGKLSVGELAAQVRETYTGPFVVGEDLMTLNVGKAEVSVTRHKK